MLVDKQSELMSDLLFTVHQHGGDDVTWKTPMGRGCFPRRVLWFPRKYNVSNFVLPNTSQKKKVSVDKRKDQYFDIL